MLTPERHKLIMEIIKEKKVAAIQDLVEGTGSSESTIRRDLVQLEKENKLLRFHGGAQLAGSKSEETTINERSLASLNEKMAIAKHAAGLVQAGDCVFLDAGTTTYHMVEHLRKDILVVTNGLSLIDHCIDKDLETYVIGGKVKPKTNAFIGKGAIDGISAYRFDKCFIGMNGIHPDFGYTTPDPEEAMIKQTAIHLSNKAFVIADESKFGRTSFSKVHDLGAAAIITNAVQDLKSLSEYRKLTQIEMVKTT
ncbi:DeoR family transcriptional regulator [Scopulibacillus darangshiensis]|uniref:DeoR family transcriptional regulator n=1 Tax=Scopulibacillus darangshiensis TaxID=442528 RepID=A0A4R2NHM3_9BACL|nr:DeoR/GlpR family DNA-binding transcription regulator [Scopulibacillus darangshiensis]TCP20861.1 DeoR family transcriptional regulator [Scopulibacillus darangshiensis]